MTAHDELAEMTLSPGDEGVVASVEGELDISNTQPVLEKLIGATPTAGGLLTLDLSGVEYMDSSGVRMLIRLADALDERKARLLIIAGEGNVARLLQLTDVGQRIDLAESTRWNGDASVKSVGAS